MTRRVLAPLALLCACSLSACAGGPATHGSAPPSPPPLGYAGLPLPPGAQLDPAGVHPRRGFSDDTGWSGSLRPDAAAPEDRIPDIVRRGRIVVGVDQSQYLLSFRDTSVGDLRGFEVDLAHEIARDIFGDPGKVDFRFVDSGKRLTSLEDEDVDIVVRTMSITPERAERVDFSVPYLTSSVRLLTPLNRGINGIADMGGKTVCVVDGSNLLELAREVTPSSNILRTRTWADCLVATQQYQADAVLADDAILAGMSAQDPHTKVLGETFGSQSYAVGVRKGQDGLVRQVNSTLERIRADGTWKRMHNEWLGDALSSSDTPPAHYRNETEGGSNGG
ncbi:glutamate ABC transporter substrate-binding protein [Corynebacterium sp. UBA2622]|uniref:glutamate ABC transporter substrate-binding protein n=1 Tax=Corynebacterium sp. UBA2622 TaxID=1946393 RepID=UPI0025B88C84|nr:transporter substrate-binding domain-containing protein [Corynebacterium sp. UBA2622]